MQHWEMGAKRRLNGTSKVNSHTDTQTHTDTHTKTHTHTHTHMDKSTYRNHWPRGRML